MKTTDDFDWNRYTQDYYGREIFSEYLLKGIPLIISNFKHDNQNELVFLDNLHPNWKELYHVIHQLKVNSIYECGCGCAHHLINNQILNPNLTVNGCDYSYSQIKLGFIHFNLGRYQFSKNLNVVDMTTIEDVEPLGKHEFVYTQAVTMHLSHDKAKKFLNNMKRLSSRYIYLIENIRAHDYDRLFEEVLPEFKVTKGGKYINYGFLLEKL